MATIGGGAIAPRSLGDCALTVAAACEFLSERRLQWQREDSSDDVTVTPMFRYVSPFYLFMLVCEHVCRSCVGKTSVM